MIKIAMADTSQKNAQITGIGGIQIEALNPQALAEWYSQKFGIEITTEHGGGFYGGIATEQGPLHVGIIPTQDPFQFSKNIALTFRVSDFEAYLSGLKSRGIEPTSQVQAEQGQMAFFSDLEGNRIGIWG